MKKKLRTLLVWILVSLSLQFGGYSLLNNQIQKIMGPPAGDDESSITSQLQATIPGSNLTNVQVSYAKDYLAYSENGTFKIFNLKKGKVVFEKKSPSDTERTLGVFTYQWLPDRNNIVYFYAKKNPNEVTTVKVDPPKPKTAASAIEPKTEDPNQAKNIPQEVPVEPKLEKRYGSPQITELYSLELPNSDEDIALDDQLHSFKTPSDSEEISAGGKIEKFVVSTATNLMYLTVTKGATQQLMKIGIMKEVSALNKPSERIDNMAISERYGTLYIDSKVRDIQQVVAIQYVAALDNDKRLVISKNPNDRILGIRNGKVYIGEVETSKLVKIKTTDDLQVVKDSPSLKTEWEGSIPINENVRMLIGVAGQLIIYDNLTAYIVADGHFADLKFHGDENYISVDGAEQIQLTRAGTSTLVELQLLKLQAIK